jgi:hypothetical protein
MGRLHLLPLSLFLYYHANLLLFFNNPSLPFIDFLPSESLSFLPQQDFLRKPPETVTPIVHQVQHSFPSSYPALSFPFPSKPSRVLTPYSNCPRNPTYYSLAHPKLSSSQPATKVTPLEIGGGCVEPFGLARVVGKLNSSCRLGIASVIGGEKRDARAER